MARTHGTSCGALIPARTWITDALEERDSPNAQNEDYASKKDSTETRRPTCGELRRSFKTPGRPPHPAEKSRKPQQVQKSVGRSRWHEAESAELLSKASTHVADSQCIDTIFAITQQLSAMVSQGNEALRANSTQASELMSQLSAQLAMQQAKADRQVAMALQQAVSAMSDAQNAMFQSSGHSEMQQLVKGSTSLKTSRPGQVQ